MVFQKGSVESMIVRVTDESDTLTTLPAATYDINEADGTPVAGQQDLIATIDGMDAVCLIDADTLAAGDYELFVTFTSGAESPRLGPHKFRVV